MSDEIVNNIFGNQLLPATSAFPVDDVFLEVPYSFQLPEDGGPNFDHCYCHNCKPGATIDHFSE
jgi:hypothetical protein